MTRPHLFLHRAPFYRKIKEYDTSIVFHFGYILDTIQAASHDSQFAAEFQLVS